MRKGIIAIIATALLGSVGLISNAYAGSITTDGSTNISLSGDINYIIGWSTHLGTNFFNSNLAEKDDSASSIPATKNQLNKTVFASTPNQGSVDLAFSSPKSHTSANILMAYDDGGIFYLKDGYVKHTFGNAHIILGKISEVFQTPTFSAAVQSPVGANGVGHTPLIELGDNFNLGGGSSLAPVIGFENNAMIVPSSSVTLSRTVVPTVAAYLPLNIATSFGSPATVYIEGEIAPAKLAYNNNEHAKTPYAIGGGISVPISTFTVMANGYYTDGLVGLAGLSAAGNETIGTNASYVYNSDKNKLITERLTWWNIEASFAPIANTTFAAGYDFAHFSHSNNSGDDYFIPGAVKDVKTTFANVAYNVTNNSTVSAELDHIWDRYTVDGGNHYSGNTNSFTTTSGNAFWMSYDYSF